MKKSLMVRSTSVAVATIAALFGFTGLAAAQTNISNTGPGSTNTISQQSGGILVQVTDSSFCAESIFCQLGKRFRADGLPLIKMSFLFFHELDKTQYIGGEVLIKNITADEFFDGMIIITRNGAEHEGQVIFNKSVEQYISGAGKTRAEKTGIIFIIIGQQHGDIGGSFSAINHQGHFSIGELYFFGMGLLVSHKGRITFRNRFVFDRQGG